MKYDTPTDADGAKACAWCGEPIRQSGIGRSRDYCRRSCRQRAYEQRQVEQQLLAHRRLWDHMASVSSRDETRSPKDSSRDETGAPVLADPGEGWVRSTDVVDAQLRELEARQAAPPPAPAQQKRRRPATPPQTPTLFEPEADGE